MDNTSLSKTNAALLIASVVASVWFLSHRERQADKLPDPTPQPIAARHLAPEGVFFLLRYVSVNTPRGPIGFEPGREVQLVKVFLERETLLVTDGKYNVEVSPRVLTNDIDVAEMAKNQDDAGQARVAIYQEITSQAYYATRQRLNMEHADHVHSADQARIMGNGVGNWRTALDEPARVSGSYYGDSGWQVISPYSPYSYFVNPTVQNTRSAGGG